MKAFAMTLSLVILTSACATNPDKVREIETKLNVKGNVGDSKLGINDKNEAIIQQERQAQDELMIQESVNMRLQDDASHEEGELKECLKYLADKRLGGNGIIPEIPDVSSLKKDDETQEDFGTTEDGSLKVVKKTSFNERLRNARSYEKSLRAMTKVLKKQGEDCQMKLEFARNKAGLPGKKTTAEGYFNANGKWVETKRGEGNLNDAFEIQADNAAKAGN
ncbi:MAG: hypothetical protein EOP04_05740 [Proteobacteria bacterium]|nr:MAG: hypothetical protein EOP04_05740 [Pseudomonadota bacterium]